VRPISAGRCVPARMDLGYGGQLRRSPVEARRWTQCLLMCTLLTTSLVLVVLRCSVSSLCLFGGARCTLFALCFVFCTCPTDYSVGLCPVCDWSRQAKVSSECHVRSWVVCAVKWRSWLPSACLNELERPALFSLFFCRLVPYPELVLTLCFLGRFVVAPLLPVPASLFAFRALT